jgi:peptidoglycan/LPS O-acetylase OafA/YrhL
MVYAMEQKKSAKLYSLQYLRAIAATGVVLVHASTIWSLQLAFF